MKTKAAVIVFILVYVYGNQLAKSYSIVNFTDFCSTNFSVNDTSCNINAEDEVMVKDMFNLRDMKKPLISIEIHLDTTPTLNEDIIFRPLEWKVSTSRTGEILLMLKLNFEELSLKTLSKDVKHVDIFLIQSPEDCLSNNSHYKDMVRQYFFCKLNITFESGLSDNIKVCNNRAKSSGLWYEENFVYECCKIVSKQIVCDEVKDDASIHCFKKAYRIGSLVIFTLILPHLVIAFVRMYTGEKLKLSVLNMNSTPPREIPGTREFEYDRGELVSSIYDIMSFKFFFSYVTGCFCCSNNRVFRAFCVHLSIEVLLVSFALIAHFIDFGFIDHRLKMILTFFQISNYIFMVLWLIFLWRIILSERRRTILTDLLWLLNSICERYGKVSKLEFTNEKKPCTNSVCCSIILYILWLFYLIPILRTIVSVFCEICSLSKDILKCCGLRVTKVFLTLLVFDFLVFFVCLCLIIFAMVFDVFVFTLIGIILNTKDFSPFITIPAFVFLYAWKCFGSIYTEYESFLEAIMKHVAKVFSFDKNFTNKGLVFCGHRPVLIFDKTGKPCISRQLFLKACNMDFHGCPGLPKERFPFAIGNFLLWISFLVLLIVLVVAFGRSYELAEGSKFLVSVAGGILPLLFAVLVDRKRRHSAHVYDLPLFSEKFNELLQKHNEDQDSSENILNEESILTRGNVQTEEHRQPRP